MKNVPAAGVSGNLLVTLYFASKIVPMMFATFAIYLGFRLFVLGVTGQASIVVNADTVKAQLLNAAPGLFFAVGGVAALIVGMWKGSSFTFSRQNPFETWAMCMPRSELRRAYEDFEEKTPETTHGQAEGRAPSKPHREEPE